MRIRDIAIGKKLGISFAAMVAGAATMGGAIYYQMSSSEATRLEYRQTNLEIRETLMMRALVARQELSVRGYLLFQDSWYIENTQRLYEDFQAEAAKLRDLTVDPELLQRLSTIESGMTAWSRQIAGEALLSLA